MILNFGLQVFIKFQYNISLHPKLCSFHLSREREEGLGVCLFVCLPNIGKYTSNSFSKNTVGHNIRLGSQNSKYVIWSNY